MTKAWIGDGQRKQRRRHSSDMHRRLFQSQSMQSHDHCMNIVKSGAGFPLCVLKLEAWTGDGCVVHTVRKI